MIKRTLFDSLRKHVPEIGITLITGPRQAGKTFFFVSAELKLQSTDVYFIRPWSAEFDKWVENWDNHLLPFPVEPGE